MTLPTVGGTKSIARAFLIISSHGLLSVNIYASKHMVKLNEAPKVQNRSFCTNRPDTTSHHRGLIGVTVCVFASHYSHVEEGVASLNVPLVVNILYQLSSTLYVLYRAVKCQQP